MIVVIGGANIDIKARSLAPARLATSNPGLVTQAIGGVARNIAEGLARLGCTVYLITVVGRDDNGRRLLAETEAAGVNVSLVEQTGLPTGSYCAVLDHSGELVAAVSDMQAMDELQPVKLERHAQLLDSAGMIVADCNLPLASLDWLLRYRSKLIVEPVSMAKAERLGALLDPMRPIFAATPNRGEACALTVEQEPALAARELLDRGFCHVMVKLGPDGALAASREGEVRHLAPIIRPDAVARDVTGAGDAAVAGLVAALERGLPFAHAVRFGQAAAARHLGGGPLSAESQLAGAVGALEFAT